MSSLALNCAGWRVAALALAALAWVQAPALAEEMADAQRAQLALGRSIYVQGLGQSGAPVQAMRNGKPLPADSVVCANCHRPSGLGQVESDLLIPPIAGNFLYAKRSEKRLVNMDPRVSKFFNQAHDPYNDVTLAQAIREGTNNAGRSMNPVMPHFALNDTELKAVTAYLKQLSAEWSPGVSDSKIHFATVITPDVDAPRREVFKAMMQTIVRQKNGSTVTASAQQSRTRHHMVSAAEMMLGTERAWDLDVWELQGAPQTWGAQLDALYQKNPPFALLSGVGGAEWQPVHDFCARQAVPCWFPSVPVPASLVPSGTFYFSGGVLLEASILARHLTQQGEPPKRVFQIYRDGYAGAAAAQALGNALNGSTVGQVQRKLPAQTPLEQALPGILKELGRGDVLMFWLSPQDMAALAAVKPPAVDSYFSSVLARSADHVLAPAWRANSKLVYVYDLPEHRARNLDNFTVWLNSHKLPLVDLGLQSEVFFAMGFLTDTLADMLDNLYRDYLVERAETMLSQREGVKSEQETRDRLFLGRAGDLEKKHGEQTIEKSARIAIPNGGEGVRPNHGTTLYSNLSLAPGQRFASKGGYIVRFGEGDAISPASAMIIP